MPETLHTRCCIAGGGPAGMMLGFLLARAGVDVIVLEKHADFLRDFRGDTIHPSTLELMYELGILDEFLRRPHQEVRQLAGQIGDDSLTLADFTHLPTHCRFLAFMPQWDFLDFIAQQANAFAGFHLKTQAEVTDLIEENNAIVGVCAQTCDGPQEIRAAFTVGADGRHSVLRERAGLKVLNIGAPMDVFWMRLSRKPSDPGQTFGRMDMGRVLVLIDRGDYWQLAFVIPKGTADEVRQRGLGALREEIGRLCPFVAGRVQELQDWKQISLLTVAVDRLQKWYRPGLLCIGDAAHAMSPIGGVGINLAIQDAVAAANILSVPLLAGSPTISDLRAVQNRRMFPTRATQAMQILIQNRVIRKILGAPRPVSLPWPLQLVNRWPWLQRIPARIIGVGFRPEHISSRLPKVSAKRAA
jgi:2-polyprenyl-6-methoxyphenol hydroxylase-like FAD-dependent oxidoreductase